MHGDDLGHGDLGDDLGHDHDDYNVADDDVGDEDNDGDARTRSWANGRLSC